MLRNGMVVGWLEFWMMVTRIAEMICFQSYNVKSPLNARAAAWAEQNIQRLPLQRGDLTAGL